MKRLAPFALVVALLAACGTARRSEPVAGPMAMSEDQRRGQQAFDTHCSRCHPGGEAGLGPGINDKPLPGFLIRFQARHGLGVMPAFDEHELAPADLDRIVDYLTALRGARPRS